MSEEILYVIGAILAVAVLGYLSAEEVFVSKLSASQIAAYASQAGFSGDDLVTAVAIALAESSGNPNATGDKTTAARSFGGASLPIGTPTSYGLWQLHWTVHPEILNGADPSILFDPQTNANQAFIIYQEQGFNAWSTYGDLPGHNNAYLAHVDEASAAVNA